jgi:adenine deaminase
MCAAVNALIAAKGGISVVQDEDNIFCMPLPVAGLMSDKDGWQTARDYTDIDRKAKELGTPLKAPFMTLSFMALLVIPSLKLSDKGLFDGGAFRFTDLVVEH